MTPFRTLQVGMEVSRPCQIGLADGVPICAFGAVPDGADDAHIWFMAAEDAFEKHSMAVLRRSAAWIYLVSGDYSTLHNVSRAIPELEFWMGWLGFKPVEEFRDNDGFAMIRYTRGADDV